MKKKLRFRKKCCCLLITLMLVFTASNVHATCDIKSESLLTEIIVSPQNMQDSIVGKKAPDFTLSVEGKSISLADFKYRYIILIFSTSSAESRTLNNNVERLKEQYKDADIAFIDIYFDENAEIAKRYGVGSAPSVCVVNPDGVVLSIDYGNIDLSAKLKDIFGM